MDEREIRVSYEMGFAGEDPCPDNFSACYTPNLLNEQMVELLFQVCSKHCGFSSYQLSLPDKLT